MGGVGEVERGAMEGECGSGKVGGGEGPKQGGHTSFLNYREKIRISGDLLL